AERDEDEGRVAIVPAEDVARLLRWFDEGTLIRPSAAAANTIGLANALASRCGLGDVQMTPAGELIAGLIGESEHYVFVMADGLGMNLVEAQAENSFLRSHVATAIQSVFPSTTAAALTSW